MTKCGDLGEISTRNLQLGEIDLKEHTYRKCIATMQCPRRGPALSMHIVNFPTKRAPFLCKHNCIR